MNLETLKIIHCHYGVIPKNIHHSFKLLELKPRTLLLKRCYIKHPQKLESISVNWPNWFVPKNRGIYLPKSVNDQQKLRNKKFAKIIKHIEIFHTSLSYLYNLVSKTEIELHRWQQWMIFCFAWRYGKYIFCQVLQLQYMRFAASYATKKSATVTTRTSSIPKDNTNCSWSPWL